ncbi:MAG: glycerol-3-phosphate 1-O-acyltransferase PlsY [Clostridia bacterium]|nr:glycerol-3-phosphate 1-O-acyltransferase PlsY [Clostridia bacterium]
MIFLGLGTIIFAYLLGSINFAVIFSKAFSKKDIRESGSGNAGATNVLRVNGIVPGVLTFVFDALKGFAACIIGKEIFAAYITPRISSIWTEPYSAAYICAVACMIGHIFPVFFTFKGGKGVAICVGIFAVCCPISIVIGLAVFTIIAVLTRYVSLASLAATLVVITLATVFRNAETPLLIQVSSCIAMAAMIYIKHLSNIKRLINGTENKFGSSKKQ